ncbi:MAG: metallophosphoesterase [Candidatus Kerfeldbacteria bacterium]|nr:metallophosphoesterase [Candidatus Kerfeldbacteria bacterium]
MRWKRFGLIAFLAAVLSLTSWSLWTLRQPLGDLGRHWLTPGTAQGVSFAVVGDNHGVNPIYTHMIGELSKQHLNFLLNLADTSEYGTAQEFTAVRNLEQKLPFPVYHTVGNHDIKADPSRGLFHQVFNQNPWSGHDIGPVHLVILDNADRKVGFPAASLDWLERDLAAHKTKTILIAYHRPFDLPLTRLIGDDETKASRRSNDRFLSIIKSYRIAYIFTGHVHTYFPYTVDGIPAVISGGGGNPAQDILGGSRANFFHYLIVTVKNGTVSVDLHRVATPS